MTSLKVLLVEDNAMNSELVQDLLEAAGHGVKVATNAASCREAFESDALYDVVLMDIMLPDGNGVTLLSELRAAGHVDGKSIIALTAHALSGDAERFMAAGFDAVLMKPINTRTFVAEVERIVAVVKGGGG